MHPAMMYWWKYGRRHADFGASAGCGPFSESRWSERSHASGERHGDSVGSALGVRRPLRFLAYKLNLGEEQVSELARILSELKTERAQSEVDGRRTVAAFADAVDGETFDEARAGEGAILRVKSADRLREAVVKALGRIHALLDRPQRAKLAYLIRTGAVSL